MKLIKIVTPKKSVISIDISKFKEVKLIEKGILEVIFEEDETSSLTEKSGNNNIYKNSFLIEGTGEDLVDIIDYILEEKNKYEEKFYSKTDIDKFFNKLSEDIVKSTKKVLKDSIYGDVMERLDKVSEKAISDLNRLESHDKLIETTNKELDEIKEKIKEIKKELF